MPSVIESPDLDEIKAVNPMPISASKSGFRNIGSWKFPILRKMLGSFGSKLGSGKRNTASTIVNFNATTPKGHKNFGSTTPNPQIPASGTYIIPYNAQIV